MRKRRGLSTVVGAVFFVIAATTVITYISTSMNSIEEFSQSVIVAEAENINRGMEEIGISQTTIVGGEFNMTVTNTGSLPVHLTRLWVTDLDSTASDKKADIDVRINPGNEKYNIGQGTGITADSTVSYTLKAVTERGNVATFKISPDVSTNVKLLVPGSAINSEIFTVTLLILNNSTSPNNIADLEPILTSNVTLTQIGTNQSNVQALKTGEMASFSWKYVSPLVAQGISFTGSYVGAPSGSFDVSNTTIYDIGEAQSATSSQWSEKARKVGILISGIPSPIDSSTGKGLARFGIGIINPLDRAVEIYSVAINSISMKMFSQSPNPIEPSSGWINRDKTGHGLLIWQNDTVPGEPRLIAPETVAQFRVTIDVREGNLELERPLMIEALTSEGKLSVLYNISMDANFPTINAFYTKDPNDPIGASNENWGYHIDDVPSGSHRMYNATVENTSDNKELEPAGTPKIAITILIPADFTYEPICTGCDNSDWTNETTITNPDGSVFIKAVSSAALGPDSHITYQFNATAPTVASNSLYVFQTTTYYPGWEEPLITASLSEAGVEVIPSP